MKYDVDDYLIRDFVRAGSGITQYSRHSNVFDPESLAEAKESERLKDFLASMSPAPTGMIVDAIKFQCRRIYQNYKLPDPLAFSHPEGEFVDVPIEEFFQDGPELKQFQERGMLLNSVTHCPGESEHSEVWYASRLALLIIRHELILAIIRDIERRVDEGRAVSSERLVGLANDLFKNGHDTGTMHKEYLMKFEFEEDALSNQKRRKSAVDNNKKRSRVSFERNRAALSRMARLSEDKVHGISATRKVVSEGLYSGKPDSLRKLYESWLKKSKNHHQKTQKQSGHPLGGPDFSVRQRFHQ